MKTLFVSPEVVPFAKTGGLADVSGALPNDLKQCGCDVRVITPFYRMALKSETKISLLIDKIKVPVGNKIYAGEIWQGWLKSSVPVYLIKCDEFFDRDRLYGSDRGDYPDNAERFIFFCRIVLETCLKLGFSPDIVHCNDWQTGLIPAYMKSLYEDAPFFSGTATLFTLHNAAYQGLFARDKFSLTGLPERFFNINGLEYWGKMSLLKSALVCSDVINTVSKRYSLEIQTEEYGCGMEGIFSSRKEDLYGILNGVDYDEWNPSRDKFIASHYSIKSIGRKRVCKKDLIIEYRLNPDMMDRPLAGCVSRLTDQKGFDLLAEVMDDLMKLGIGFVLLGTGERKYHRLFTSMGKKYRGRAGVQIAYDDRTAHKIEAGCDMFIMPSRYEPCGLNQVYSLRYGTVPVVRATGGLDDTILDYDMKTGSGNGFKFQPYSAAELLKTVQRALAVYEDKKQWKKLMINCMSGDFSWEKSARKYIKLYRTALRKKKKGLI
jgi:starch synthase